MMAADDYHMRSAELGFRERESAATRIRTRAAQEMSKLSERLSAFGEKAKRVLTGQGRGDMSHAGAYNNLNESLLSEEGDGTTIGQDSSSHRSANYVAPVPRTSGVVPGMAEVPSEAEMMVQTTLLAREAAELLWETIAFQSGCGDKDPAMAAQMQDLVQKAEMLNSQLRGSIRNQIEGIGGDQAASESALADALEAKDMLDSCLGEYKKASEGGSQPQSSAPQPNDGAPPTEGGDHLDSIEALEPPPLIQLEDEIPPPSTQAPTTSPLLSAPSPPADPFVGSPNSSVPFDSSMDTLPYGK